MPNEVAGLEKVMRGLTDAERANLLRVTYDLGIKEDDAIWAVLLALDHYKKLYEDVPETIREAVSEAASEAVSKIEEGAEAAAEGSRARLEDLLAEAVAKTAAAAAPVMERRKLWEAGVLGALVVGAVGALCLSVGIAMGRSAGRSDALELNAAASWAATPSGVKAFRFYRDGTLDHFINCDRPGWEVKAGVCYPNITSSGRVYGWSLPR